MSTPIGGATESGRPRRRLLRLSVRAMMLVVLVLAVVLGWIIHRARVQREAVAAIEKSGGEVIYDWELTPGRGRNPNGRPRGPNWLVEWLGVDYFGDVVIASLGKQATDVEMAHLGRLNRLEGMSVADGAEVTDAGTAYLKGLIHLDHVNLSGTRVSGASLPNLRGLFHLKSLHLVGIPVADADLADLEGLTALEILDLSSTSVTDAGLVHLEPLVKLKQIRLGRTNVTGEGLSHLKGMVQLTIISMIGSRLATIESLPALPRLKTLALSGSPIGDAGLAGISRFESLRILSMPGTSVTSAGLIHIQGLKRLTDLMLSKTKVTDAGMPALAKLASLSRIYLDETALTDEGLAVLAKCPSLAHLGLAKTRITDAGLDHLAASKSLANLDVAGTDATEAGLNRLRKALPQLKVANPGQGAVARARGASTRPPSNPGPRP